jgi:hypothetical protein
VDCARKIDGRASVAAAMVMPNTAFRRVTGRVVIKCICKGAAAAISRRRSMLF